MSDASAIGKPVRPRGIRMTVRLESVAVLAVLIAALAVLSPYFLSLSNFLNISRQNNSIQSMLL